VCGRDSINCSGLEIRSKKRLTGRSVSVAVTSNDWLCSSPWSIEPWRRRAKMYGQQ
jgi:hypothetical protein